MFQNFQINSYRISNISRAYKINILYKISQLDLAPSPLEASNLIYNHLCYKFGAILQLYLEIQKYITTPF